MIDMLRLLPQYTAEEFDSRHRLAIVAAQRTKHILQGSRHAPSRFTNDTGMFSFSIPLYKRPIAMRPTNDE